MGRRKKKKKNRGRGVGRGKGVGEELGEGGAPRNGQNRLKGVSFPRRSKDFFGDLSFNFPVEIVSAPLLPPTIPFRPPTPFSPFPFFLVCAQDTRTRLCHLCFFLAADRETRTEEEGWEGSIFGTRGRLGRWWGLVGGGGGWWWGGDVSLLSWRAIDTW